MRPSFRGQANEALGGHLPLMHLLCTKHLWLSAEYCLVVGIHAVMSSGHGTLCSAEAWVSLCHHIEIIALEDRDTAGIEIQGWRRTTSKGEHGANL